MALGLCRGAGIKGPGSLEKAVVTLGWSAQESAISKMRLELTLEKQNTGRAKGRDTQSSN